MTAYFADGLAASSQENILTKAGVKTAVELSAKTPTEIRYIQGVVKIPKGFDRVAQIDFAPDQITLVSPAGTKVTAPVNHGFLKSGKLE